ncbi:MAG: response regulator [Candidatus Freyarchaeum deiterrae]
MERGKKKILVIDDDKSILEIFKLILQKEGYNTDTAETGKEALNKIAKEPYALALIDVKLPDMDGTDLLHTMNETRPKMIKIMVTGFPSEESQIKALNGGADAYLVKPVNPRDLIKTVKEKLKEQKA